MDNFLIFGQNMQVFWLKNCWNLNGILLNDKRCQNLNDKRWTLLEEFER